MEPGSAHSTSPTGTILVILLFYSLALESGLGLPEGWSATLAFWASTGLALAAFFLVSRQAWPALGFGLYLAGGLIGFLNNRGLPASLGLSAILVLEAWICAVFLRRGGAGDRLDLAEPNKVFSLIVGAFVLNGLLVLAAAGLTLAFQGVDARQVWFPIYVDEALGQLLVAPLILSFRGFRPFHDRRRLASRLADLVFLALWLTGSWLCFDSLGPTLLPLLQPYVLVLLLAWPALGSSPRTLALSLIALGMIAIASEAVVLGPSPLAGRDPRERLLYLEIFLAAVTASAWLAYAVFAARSVSKDRDEEGKIHVLADCIPDGFFYRLSMGKEGGRRFLYLSSQFEGLTGLDREAVIADADLLYARIHPEELPALLAAETEAAAGPRDFKATFRLQRPDGTWRWVRVSSSPLLMPDASLLWSGVLLDISHERAVEEELRSGEARYRTVLERAGDGIFISDSSGRFIEVNEKGAELLGRPREEVLTLGMSELVEDSGREQPPLSIQEGSSERRILRGDGSLIDVEINAKTVDDGRMVGIVRDVTERKRAERLMRFRMELGEKAETAPLVGLLRAIVDEAERLTGSTIGFCHLIDEDGRTVFLQGWSTNTLTEMCGLSGSGGHSDVEEAGIWIEAVRLRRPVIHNDYAGLPAGGGLPEGHAALVRELLVPVLRRGRVAAVIGVGNKQTNYDLADSERIRDLVELSWDIVERRRTRELLSETEARFVAVFRGSPVATILSRLETGLIVDVNDAATEVFGYRRDEFLGRTKLELGLYVDPKDREDQVERARAGRSGVVETRFRRRGGEIFDVMVSTEIVHIKGEHFLVSQVLDVTDRNGEEALRESEAGLRLAQGIAGIGDWTWNVGSDRVKWSEGMYAIFGVDKASFEPTLEGVLSLVHPEDRKSVEAATAAVREGWNAGSTLEFRVNRPDGTQRSIVGIPGHVSYDATGKILGLSGIYQDITERKRAEEEILRALAEKEILLRELYHRANNNMQVITALLEFQSQEFHDERLSRAIADTQDRIGSIALVNRKLYEAKDLSHIDLREYIGELARIISESYGPRRGKLVLVPDLEEVRVLIDTAIPCGLILNELISNVFKHAYPDEGPGEILISLRKDSRGVIRLRVADHGVGVPVGFDFAKNGRIGLQSIVGLCASQLRGEVLFDTEAGLACELRFSDDLYEARV